MTLIEDAITDETPISPQITALHHRRNAICATPNHARETRQMVQSKAEEIATQSAKESEISQMLEAEFKSRPLFFIQKKLAYNHNMLFSYAGSAFDIFIYELDDDLQAMAYDFVTSVYPEHAEELQAQMLKSNGQEGLARMMNNQPCIGSVMGKKHPWSLDNLLKGLAKDEELKYYKYVQELHKMMKLGASLPVEEEKLMNQSNFTLDGHKDLLPPDQFFRKPTFVESQEDLSDFLAVLATIPRNGSPNLFISCHRNDLSREGKLCMMTIFIEFGKIQQTWIIDLLRLPLEPFWKLSSGRKGTSLRSIFESSKVPKVFFDVRNASDILRSHYGIRLQGVIDLQLMELVTRDGSQYERLSIFETISKFPKLMPWKEMSQWYYGKEVETNIWNNDTWRFWTRTMQPAVREYVVSDTECLAWLFAVLGEKLISDEEGRKLVIEESRKAVFEGAAKDYHNQDRMSRRMLAPLVFSRLGAEQGGN